jgi:peptidase E
MSDEHTYGRDEWQTAQITWMPVATLEREHAATTVDEYRDKLEAEFKRRGIAVPDVPAPKPRRRRAKK